MKDQQNQNNEFGDNWIQTFDHDTEGWDKKLPHQPTSNGLLVVILMILAASALAGLMQ